MKVAPAEDAYAQDSRGTRAYNSLFPLTFSLQHLALYPSLVKFLKKSVTLNDRHGNGLIMTASLALSLSSLNITSARSTFPHFSLSFSDIVHFFNAAWRSCSLCLGEIKVTVTFAHGFYVSSSPVHSLINAHTRGTVYMSIYRLLQTLVQRAQQFMVKSFKHACTHTHTHTHTYVATCNTHRHTRIYKCIQ